MTRLSTDQCQEQHRARKAYISGTFSEIYWTPIKYVKELENLRDLRDLRDCGYDPAVSPMCRPLTYTEQRSRPSNSRSDRRSDQEL